MGKTVHGLLLAVLLVGAGCSPSSLTNLCTGVPCPEGSMCNPASGLCEGQVDPVVALDAGIDGGESADGGEGGGIDGGISCEPACNGATPVCDLSSRTCVTCTPTEGCAGATPLCDTRVAAGVCVGCLNDNDCPLSAPLCNPTSQTCTVGCTTHAQCSGATPVCDQAKGLCVACVQDQDCGGSTPVCAPSQTCVTCTATAGCSGATPVCDLAVPGGQCVACLNDAQCSGATPACHPTSRTCVLCTHSVHCGGATPACDTASSTCVGCLANTDCQGATPVCQTATRTCVGCVAHSDCQNPLPVCGANNTCARCTTSTQCGAGRVCDASGACQTLPDACATAQVLQFAAGSDTVVVVANPSLGADEYALPCHTAPVASPELVYKLTLTSPKDLSVVAQRAGGSTARPVVMLRKAPCETSASLACDLGTLQQGAASFTLNNLAAGDYFLFVESQGGASGNINVVVTATTPTPPPTNDTCATAQSLVFTNEAAQITGDNTLAQNHNQSNSQSPTCTQTAGQSGRDLIYSYTLTATRNVTITVAPLPGSALRPAVYVRKPGTCNSGAASDELGCDAVGASTPVSVQLTNQGPGTYFIWVDGVQGTTGKFQLDVRLSGPPANDSCATAQALTFFGGVASATGDTSFATNHNQQSDAAPTCSQSAKGSGGRDVVYSYTLTASQDVSVEVAPLGANPSFQPVLYVRAPGHCASAAQADELGCAADFQPVPQRLNLLNQQPGTYFVWVDSAQNTRGPFTLTVKLSSPTLPPSNDNCATAQALTFNGNVASATGNTASANNDNSPQDVGPSCSTTARQSGKDVVYSYQLSAPQDVRITATPTGANPSFRPVLYVRADGQCANASCTEELACVAGFNSVPRTVSLLNQKPGTYFLWVDGSQDTEGAFSLEVQLLPPTAPPANDECAGAQVLGFQGTVATASGDTSTAGNSNGCGDPVPSCSQNARLSGRDLVYQYTLAVAQDVTVNVAAAPGSALRPVVYARKGGACSSLSLSDELACDAALQGSASLRLINQAPGAYFLFVDAEQGTAGPFNLTVNLAPPTLPPANDTCSAPTVLTFSGSTATGMGTTVGATNSNKSTDLTPTCHTGYPRNFGADVVFQYSLAAAQDVAISVIPSNGLAPVIYVRQPNQCTSPSPAHEQGCTRANSSGNPVNLNLVNQPPGTYFLFVDSQSAAAGNFTVVVNVSAPTQPAPNDTCATAINIPLGPTGVQGHNANARDDYSAGSLPPYASACNQAPNFGHDVVYQFTATSTGTVTATLTPAAGFDPALLLLQPSCRADQCVAVSDTPGPGLSESLIISVVAGQTYFLVVDAFAQGPTSAGTFTLTVQ